MTKVNDSAKHKQRDRLAFLNFSMAAIFLDEIEITPEMIEAGVNSLAGHYEIHLMNDDCNDDAARDCFRAMVRAAIGDSVDR
jgi:hypothetical protein